MIRNKIVFLQIENLIYKMQKLIVRSKQTLVKEYLNVFPAVAILGSRQCGKSTLIKMMTKQMPKMLYLDLQNREDLAKLSEPSLFFKSNADKVICLDEIQQVPDLFSILRSEIDRDRRVGRFILLGSASRELLQNTSETLAGRIGLIDMTPFTFSELSTDKKFALNRFWLRGGYPDSYLALSDEYSSLWRESFIRTYIERDIPQFGFQITARQMLRLMSMLAHLHGQMLNCSKLGESLGLTHPTIKRYIDVLEQTYLIRTLPPFFVNTKKRIIKSPKIYVRDSGLLHQLLQIKTFNNLLGHPIFGASWEGFVVENVCSSLQDAEFSFFRSALGEEMDLIVQKNSKLVAIECKASTAPQLTQGFWKTIDLIKPDKTFVVAPIEQKYELRDNVQVVNLGDLLQLLNEILN